MCFFITVLAVLDPSERSLKAARGGGERGQALQAGAGASSRELPPVDAPVELAGPLALGKEEVWPAILVQVRRDHSGRHRAQSSTARGYHSQETGQRATQTH